jgi:predicted nucleotidyltransferase
MKNIQKLLDKNQLSAVELFKDKVSQEYDIANIIVYGSTTQRKTEEGSDLDILVVTKKMLAHRDRHEIQNIATKINWHYDTNISATIVDEYNWEQGLYSLMLIKDEVLRNGVSV